MTVSSGKTNVTLRIGKATSSTIIGVQYNSLSPKQERPSDEQLIAYLRAIDAPGAKEKKPELEEFFKAKFNVFGEEPPLELGDAIEQIWTEDDNDHVSAGIVILAENGSGKTLALFDLYKRLADRILRQWNEPYEQKDDLEKPKS